MASALATAVPVFFISDNTGVTAETVGNALMANFPGIRFSRRTFPFVDSRTSAQQVLREARAAGPSSVLLTTLRSAEVSAELSAGPFPVVDLMQGPLADLERVLGVGRTEDVVPHHGVGDPQRYNARMRAVEYTLRHDDGQSMSSLSGADLILLAPSRCGKTPTALYLALRQGLQVANYPLTGDDYPSTELPLEVAPYRARCFGLTSTAQRLSQVRQERRPRSVYAGLSQCRQELRWAESLYRRHSIPSLNTASRSVEEIAAAIVQTMHDRLPETSFST